MTTYWNCGHSKNSYYVFKLKTYLNIGLIFRIRVFSVLIFQFEEKSAVSMEMCLLYICERVCVCYTLHYMAGSIQLSVYILINKYIPFHSHFSKRLWSKCTHSIHTQYTHTDTHHRGRGKLLYILYVWISFSFFFSELFGYTIAMTYCACKALRKIF